MSSHPAFVAPAFVADVTRVVEDLRTLNRSTEADFLAVGANLMSFLSAARGIRADIGQLADNISGAASERARYALAAVLDTSAEMQARIGETTQSLDRIRNGADLVLRAFSGFNNIVWSFRVVATLGRIETARLEGSHGDLGHLATAVRSSTDKIQASVQSALNAAAGLGQSIELTITHISRLDTEQLKALPSLIGAVENGLQAFRLRQGQARLTSANLSREFSSFSEAMDRLVTAIQFHDITRQQIEHAIEALALVTGNADAGTSPFSMDELAAMELQRRQLSGAGTIFAASVEQVKRQLEQIAVPAREMAGEANTLLGLAEGRQGSFFLQIERCFTDVLAVVSNCSAVNGETAAATAGLQGTIAGLRACMHDIRDVASVIKYLGINATISAVQMAGAGGPLGVVAGALQALHADVGKHSAQTENLLAALASALLSMTPTAQGAEASPPVGGNTAAMGELRTGIHELRASGERALVCSRQISEAAATLCAGVQQASDGFRAGSLVETTLARCCDVLQRITENCGTGYAGSADGLEHLAAQYTMQSEREVHRTALSGPAERDSRLTPALGEPGDDVELF